MTRNIRSIAVYGGTSVPPNREFHALAIELGQALADRKIEVCYLKGRGELPQICAEAAIAGGGTTQAIDAHLSPDSVLQAQHLHDMAARIIERADCAIFLPGGVETISDVAELLSWRVLSHYEKPIAIVPKAFWTPLEAVFEQMIGKRLLRDSFPQEYILADSIPAALDALNLAAQTPSASRAE